MPLTSQQISPGYLADAYQEESNRLRAGEAVQKMWAKQPSLWKDDSEHARIIANRLGWIGVLDSMRAETPALRDLARDVASKSGKTIETLSHFFYFHRRLAMLGERLSLPVLLGYGPRYLHSTGQLYKGGPDSGMFLMITSEKSEDLPIPGAKYTLGQLEMAQALGDLQSLGSLGKPALRLHLVEGAPTGLGSLRRAVDQAFSASRSAT